MTAPATIDTAGLAQALAEACGQVPAWQGAAGLAQALRRIAPQMSFREVLTRGGWYRLGGVADATGRVIADDIERWIADALASHDDDLAAVAAAYANVPLFATRLLGKTHYWVARTGPDAADFLQIEIEELQQALCHPLFPDGEPPASLEDLVDPPADCPGSRQALGAPFYSLRRVTAMAEFLAAMRAQKPDPQPIHRFVADWTRSSALASSDFTDHWVIAVREHLDRYRQPIRSASPVAVSSRPPRFDSPYGARGLALAAALQRFDKQAGYPMAWFFHMLTTKAVPHAVDAVVIEDVQEGFGYLPDRDVQVVRDWLHQPYGF
ncbi:MAG: hypothetical protein N2690_04395 [Rhodocyclaceae bacterium]|nr:hypothetical protein [Rhodocyclaceae bacterium]